MEISTRGAGQMERFNALHNLNFPGAAFILLFSLALFQDPTIAAGLADELYTPPGLSSERGITASL